MPTGTLVHITAARKLMVKISEKTYDNLHDRLYNESKKKNFPTERLAVFTKEDDHGEEEWFAMIALDKYDKQNMPKFEQLVRKNICFSARMKPYDFMNDDNEQICGINLELVSIRQMKPRVDENLKQTKPKAKWNADLWKFEINEEELQCMMQKANAMGKHLVIDPTGAHFCSSDDSDSEIDEIADKAAARACSKETELNAEEQAIDEDVEKRVSKRFPLAPPVLERQMATAATHRRRRVQPSEESLAAADYQMPEEIKAFAVIDAFEQEE